MSGPLGGQPGAAPRGGKGPGQRRMLLKGLKMGSYVLICYREKKGLGYVEERVDYEGTIVDKRVGWDNRESYVELKDCIRLNSKGEIAVRGGKKRLFDAFIEDCEVVERSDRPLSAELAAAEGLIAGTPEDSSSGAQTGCTGFVPAGCMMPMGMGMGAMMPMMMAGGMPMGMPLAMGAGLPMGMGSGMPMAMGAGMPMGMACPMPMMPMGCGGMMAMPMVGYPGMMAGAAQQTSPAVVAGAMQTFAAMPQPGIAAPPGSPSTLPAVLATSTPATFAPTPATAPALPSSTLLTVPALPVAFGGCFNGCNPAPTMTAVMAPPAVISTSPEAPTLPVSSQLFAVDSLATGGVATAGLVDAQRQRSRSRSRGR